MEEGGRRYGDGRGRRGGWKREGGEIGGVEEGRKGRGDGITVSSDEPITA